MKYIYKQEFYGITNVKMEFYDRHGSFHVTVMDYEKESHYWICECDKEIIRYKFIVNGVIRLNDPEAGEYMLDEKQEVWSIPEKNKENVPELIAYGISNIPKQSTKTVMKKATYVYDRPLDIYVGVEIQKVSEIHSITYMCFQPDGRIYKIEECSIGQYGKEADYEVVFNNHIAHIQGQTAEGMWTFQAYLDGRCIIKDYFVLKKKIINNRALFNYRMQ